jgi:hypothetical protein
MTKEEILDNQVDRGCSGVTRTAQDRYGRFDKRIILSSMDEYAKQQAIEFDVWKRNNCYTIDACGDAYIKLAVEGDSAITYPVPANAVYRQFIESQNK